MKYSYIFTVQYPGPGGRGFGLRTQSGVIEVEPGQSRHAILMDLYNQATQATGADHVDVLFFELEPDTLGGGS